MGQTIQFPTKQALAEPWDRLEASFRARLSAAPYAVPKEDLDELIGRFRLIFDSYAVQFGTRIDVPADGTEQEIREAIKAAVNGMAEQIFAFMRGWFETACERELVIWQWETGRLRPPTKSGA